ncbi:MAG TPA: hypothetical protein VJU82_18870 [Acidobacteriaceae bacterium]|nr:hypothetical protein [Acidobacteriaceae bacterium]
MIVGVRRGLRAASMLLLSVAAPVFLCISNAVAEPGHRIAASDTQPHLTPRQLHPSPRTGPHLRSAVTCRSLLFHLASRAFAEDAPPPPSETLETAQLQLPLAPAAIARAGSPVLRSDSFCTCNRQRAP